MATIFIIGLFLTMICLNISIAILSPIILIDSSLFNVIILIVAILLVLTHFIFNISLMSYCLRENNALNLNKNMDFEQILTKIKSMFIFVLNGHFFTFKRLLNFKCKLIKDDYFDKNIDF